MTHNEFKKKEYFAGVMVLFGLFVLIIVGFMLKRERIKEKPGLTKVITTQLHNLKTENKPDEERFSDGFLSFKLYHI